MVERWFDTWQAFLRILMYWVFFVVILLATGVFAGLLYGGIYAYGWWTMWATVAFLVAYREVARRAKAEASRYKMIYRPNAMKEYVQIPSVKAKKERT